MMSSDAPPLSAGGRRWGGLGGVSPALRTHRVWRTLIEYDRLLASLITDVSQRHKHTLCCTSGFLSLLRSVSGKDASPGFVSLLQPRILAVASFSPRKPLAQLFLVMGEDKGPGLLLSSSLTEGEKLLCLVLEGKRDDHRCGVLVGEVGLQMLKGHADGGVVGVFGQGAWMLG